MIPAWYAVVSFMLIAYVVLDGRNFGAGMLHWFIARTPQERRQVVAAIGPLWSWHEVWLVGFGGSLMAVFPRLMAIGFAGYYLALMLILWGLILRGISLEVAGHIDDRMWQGFWDFVFVCSSLLLAILFGAAAGNVVRGVPLDANGSFSMAFFTDFSVRGNVGLLDWYTGSVAAFSVIVLAAHGATYLALKTDGAVHARSAMWARNLWTVAVPLFLLVSAETWFVRPDLVAHAIANPLCWVGVIVVCIAIVLLTSGVVAGHEPRAFVASNLVLIGLLGTGSAALFPVMLYSTFAPEYSLTAYNVASSPKALWYASMWWPLGVALALAYFIVISWRYSGKVSVQRDNQGFY